MGLKFIVAIGYSEGGLEPLLTFFDHVPHDEATYIILRHIPIGQRGALREILLRHSKLEIVEAEDGMPIENDVVYIPPSTSYLSIKNDTLYLHPRVMESRSYNYAINTFLQSLAEAKADKSIAVVLSGNGFDGAAGVTHIHQAGGIAIAQIPASCSNPEMPQYAIDTKCVDKILLPSEMPAFITRHVHPILNNENVVKRLKN
jgi:two-component system CheB/CheR fusion protein